MRVPHRSNKSGRWRCQADHPPPETTSRRARRTYVRRPPPHGLADPPSGIWRGCMPLGTPARPAAD
eukprot:1496735-Prymnesium_polylepis.1